MEEIGKQISELLFDNDCVIVPSLGGFLASNQSSRVLLPNHIIYPPYRRIAFNVYLKQNDGLLANHLAESENIPYTEAAQRIDTFAAGCFETLDNGRKVNITEVGTLYYDKEKNIQFEAFRNFNHMKDSFGMEAVHFLPLQNDETVEKKKIRTEKIMKPSIPVKKENRSKFNFSNGKRYLGITAIIAAVVWFSLNLYLVAPKHYESTSLNPFDSQNIILSKTDSIRNIPSDIHKDLNSSDETSDVSSVPAETLAATNEINDNSNKIDKTDDTSVKRNSEPEPSISQQPVIKKEEVVNGSGNKHFIIAGVFKIKENALSMLLHLQQLGFTNAQIIEANRFNYVSYEGFTQREEAQSMADSLRKKNIEGWIWKH